MKLKLIIITFFSALTTFAQNKPAYLIFNKDGNQVTYNQMIDDFKSADMVFFGELHNNAISHWLEFEVAKELFAAYQQNLIIGAEMFEADNQIIIDEYMNDLIDVKNFEEECRLWPNYTTDYKPILEYAKTNSITLIATNIPRRYASIVYKKDFVGLNNLSDQAKKYIAPLPITFDPTVDCYQQMIQGMMSMGGHGSTNIAKAQAVKDATMAYFILQNWQKGKVFYHFNGSYHSDNHEGICWHISQTNPNIKMITISTVLQENISTLSDDYIGIADYIICVPEDMTTTY
ncbi:MAG: ChaN family lipoprotein [Bacteroidales bacterium]|nr:ChaN family lipoprotein [Bacteroidales bacterium]